MAFTYFASLVFLLGGEIAYLWPSVRAGDYDPGKGDDDGPSKSFGQEVLGFLRSLVSRNPTTEHEASGSPSERR